MEWRSTNIVYKRMGRWNGEALTLFISGWGDGMEEHQHCLLADGEMEWRSTNIVY